MDQVIDLSDWTGGRVPSFDAQDYYVSDIGRVAANGGGIADTKQPGQARRDLCPGAATILLDPLAITVFDAAHSQDEERWFTLGTSSDGKLLAVAHTYQQAETDTQARVRIISARPATRREREQYECAPR